MKNQEIKEQLDRIEQKVDSLEKKLDQHINEIWTVYKPVSYTHLTLPTILLV